jgi:hypothetical protein
MSGSSFGDITRPRRFPAVRQPRVGCTRLPWMMPGLPELTELGWLLDIPSAR